MINNTISSAEKSTESNKSVHRNARKIQLEEKDILTFQHYEPTYNFNPELLRKAIKCLIHMSEFQFR